MASNTRVAQRSDLQPQQVTERLASTLPGLPMAALGLGLPGAREPRGGDAGECTGCGKHAAPDEALDQVVVH